MRATPPGPDGVDLRPRIVTPRRLGAAAVVYGVFVAGWYLGQPVTPECRVDQAALDRAAERYRPEPSPTPSPTPSAGPAGIPSPWAYSDFSVESGRATMAVTITSYAVACTNDTSERPRLTAWFGGERG
ncbi:hypothetical protein [Streptomyces sp. M92]|uniref:hypothetical protein n=1 Tax=Streptomyces sp. M92 TaxID=2944250 RepID=UPI00234B5078|nr:hypothetical protein [Streptomyces sp. M92]WCN01817.1 hypothetical protein M6G08_06890 [Streptomyces sp. M92]